MAKNDKRIAVTLECKVCKRRNYITTKNKVNDRERIEIKKYCRWDRTTRSTRRPAERTRWRSPGDGVTSRSSPVEPPMPS